MATIRNTPPSETPYRRATLTYVTDARWSTVNRAIREHWAPRARGTAALREYAWAKANESGARLPRLKAAHLVVLPEHGDTAKLPDTDAVALAVKALLDGLVDARVLPGDTGEHVLSVTYLPAIRTDRNALTIELIEGTPSGPSTCLLFLSDALRRLYSDWTRARWP